MTCYAYTTDMMEMLFNILVSFVNEFFGFRAFLKTKTRQLEQRLTNCYLGKPGEDVRFMRSQGRGGGEDGESYYCMETRNLPRQYQRIAG